MNEILSLDSLSIRTEAQKVVCSAESDKTICNRMDYGLSEEADTLCSVEDLIEQEAITIF